MKGLLIGDIYARIAGVQQMLTRGSPAVTSQAITGHQLDQVTIERGVGLVLIAPGSWLDLHAWLPHLRRRFASLPWLVMAELPLAGLFFPPHERHFCGFISRHATAAELTAAAEAVLRGRRLLRPLPMLELLLDHAPHRTPGIQIQAPTDVEFQCGCGIALGLTNAEIAQCRSVTVSTVKENATMLFRKPGCRDPGKVRELFNQALVYPSSYPGGWKSPDFRV